MNNPYVVVGIGDLVTDVILLIDRLPVENGVGQRVHKVDIQPGGMGNFIIAGARLGMRMVPMGLVGVDATSAVAMQIYQAERVDTACILRKPEYPPDVCYVLVGESGQHAFLSTDLGAVDPIPLPGAWNDTLHQADALLAEGYTLKEPALQDALLTAMAHVYGRGQLVVLDPGPKIQQAPAAVIETALSLSTAVVLTLEEIRLLTGGPSNLTQARALLSRGPRLVCVKLGERGCCLITADDEIYCAGYPVEVVDTTAAGDTFNAAFIYAYLKGFPLPTLGAFANAMGAAKVQKLGGGQNVPTLQELREILAANKVAVDL